MNKRLRTSNRKTDRVYVFNGRFAAMRAVLRACQRMNVDCYIHERGCDGDHYDLFKNHLMHEVDAIEIAINELWERATSDPNRESIASSWFHDRVDRVEKIWHSFVKNQETGRLPPAWDPNRKNIAIFCSSDDEFVAIGESWQNDIYLNQATGISRIADDLLKLQDQHSEASDAIVAKTEHLISLVHQHVHGV